ncbi:major facilitator superfamily domain-containing protein [Mucor mucedo]|uniref:major facilitator superfamily domain-containing protein n=1 Tax=Mucor mucedo TaxID=29922 RepID=UPI00221EEBCD|nr:major facilitator superfamily domain-containing protein [Mucor mucedo]KAI7876656.1 major facilitator superfamily domain-containing protein [Mucor mucedo]
MSHSNRTSFMTADTGSTRNSMGSTIEQDIQYPHYNRHHHTSHHVELSKHDGELPRHKSVLRKKTNTELQHIHKPENNRDYDNSHRASFSTESLESSHTVINESSQSSYNLKEKPNILLNAELSPRNTNSETMTPELKTYPIAWVLLFSIVVLRAATAIFGNTFSPIPSVTAEFMGISLSSINWIYNVMSICYIVASFFTSWLYLVIGVKWSLVLSGVILSIGCWVRWVAVKISPPSFPILMIGQTIASFSSPISLNIMTMFSTLWFTENRRATAGMFIVSNYGAIIAMFLMPSIATGSDKIELTVIVVACIATAATIPFLFFPTKPATPASYSVNNAADKNLSLPEMTLLQGTVILLKNPHFLTLCVVHGLNVGLSIAWNGLMNQAISPYGYTDNQVGNIAAIGVVGGTLGCLISGPVIDKTKQHTILLKIMTPLMFSTYVAFIFVVKKDSFAAILYTNALSQFFLSFMVPVCVELGVEISYPVPESLSTSILWQIAQVIGFALVIVMDLFRDTNGVPKNNLYKALIFQAVVAGVCLLFAVVFNGPMTRSIALKEQEEIRKTKLLGLNNTNTRGFFESNETLQGLDADHLNYPHKVGEVA